MSVAALPRRGSSLGSGGFGDVFTDPADASTAIKIFKDALRGPAATRLLQLVQLAHELRPSERTFLTSRFAWPLEAFGTQRKLLGYRMPLAPQSAIFELTVAGNDRRELLQAKYVLDSAYWARAAVGSEPPSLSTEGRKLIAVDLLRSFQFLHERGFAFTDLSANNACIRLEDLPGVFLLDADSVVAADDRTSAAVDTVDWEADRALSPAARDWVKASMFIWRLFLARPRPRPDRAAVDELDMEVGVRLGRAIVGLHEDPDDHAAAALLSELDDSLETATQHRLVAAAVERGHAREVLALHRLPVLKANPDLLASAQAQIALEERVEAAEGLQLRLLLRGARSSGTGTYVLDVVKQLDHPVVPTNAAEFEQLVLNARYDEVLDLFVTDRLAGFTSHGWLERAIQHALAPDEPPIITIEEQPGSFTARFRWPTSAIISAALIRMYVNRTLTEARIVERQPSHSSVRIDGVGAGLPQGSPIVLQVVFMVRDGSGHSVHSPVDATVQLNAPVSRERPEPRRIRPTPGRPGSTSESVVDVARRAPQSRRRSRRRVLVGAAVIATLLLVSLGFLLRSGDAPERMIEAVAVQRDDGVEILWTQRSEVGTELAVRSAVVQRQVLGPLWLRTGDPQTLEQIAPGEVVRITVDGDPSGTYRVRAVLVGDGGSITSPALAATPPPVGSRERPPSIAGVMVSSSSDGAVTVRWEWPDVGPGRLLDRVQIIVTDRDGNLVARLETRQLNGVIAPRLVATSPRGLEVIVRGFTSDGLRSGWSAPVVVSTAAEPPPAPMIVGIGVDAEGDVRLRWSILDVPASGGVRGFDVRAVDTSTGITSNFVTTSQDLPVADLLQPSFDGVLEVRVRAVTGDRSRSPWSDTFSVEATAVRQLTG